MAKEDWGTTKLPIQMMEAIDRFLETDMAKKHGIFSRPDFLKALVVESFPKQVFKTAWNTMTRAITI